LSAIDLAWEWKVLPSALNLCRLDEDIPVMLAYLDTKRTMAAYDDHLQAEEMNRATKKKGKKK